MYLRRPNAGIYLSVFVVYPQQEEGKISVLFTRKALANYVGIGGQLGGLSDFLGSKLSIDKERCSVFVDGPVDTDIPSKYGFNYLCTRMSRDLPAFEDYASEGPVRRWVLGGWTLKEAVNALATSEVDQDKVKKSYLLSGGRFYDIVDALTPQGFIQVKDSVDQFISNARSKEIYLAVLPSTPNLNTPPRLGTLFRTDGCQSNDMMKEFQLVDSSYALNCLSQIADQKPFFEAYKIVRSLCNKDMEGMYFENLVHQWFQKVRPPPITAISWAYGFGRDSVRKLKEYDVYWISNIHKFCNFESALVTGKTLHLFQITATEDHIFNPTLAEEFINSAKESLRFQSVTIWLVVPKQINLSLGSFEQHESRWERRVHEVDVTSMDTIRASLQTFPFLSGESVTVSVRKRLRSS
jgi:hypothetical protein